jgi:AraC-like DNA-binding protein
VLQANVKRFWVLEKEYTSKCNIEEVIPDACIELVLNFGCAYQHTEDSTHRELPKICLIGLQRKPLVLQAKGVVKIVGVRFFAWGVLPFLTESVQPGGTTRVELDDSWREVVSRVSTQVQAGRYQDAVAEIEDFLIGKRLSTLFEPRKVQAAAKLLYRTRGKFRVADLADYCNLSVRQLQRRFEDAMNLPPKTLARTIRFEAIRNRLMFEPDANLTDLAHEFGFTDQAHFIRDFKTFTNKTPGQYAAVAQKLQQLFSENENVVFLQSPPSMLDYSEDDLGTGGLPNEENFNFWPYGKTL